jgi:hypothetical protein
MSATLYALVVLQGTTFSFDPGYTSKAECEAQYKGGHVLCYPYDPQGTSWSIFFRLSPVGGVSAGKGFPNKDTCELYAGALKEGVPTACRQLAYPTTCTPVACVAPAQPPAPPPAKPEAPKPDSNQPPAASMSVGPTALKDADKPYLEPRIEPTKPRATRVAVRRRHQQPQQFDPIEALVSLLTPRDW